MQDLATERFGATPNCSSAVRCRTVAPVFKISEAVFGGQAGRGGISSRSIPLWRVAVWSLEGVGQRGPARRSGMTDTLQLICDCSRNRAWSPPPSSSLAEERTPLLAPPPCGGARFSDARNRACNARAIARGVRRRRRLPQRKERLCSLLHRAAARDFPTLAIGLVNARAIAPCEGPAETTDWWHRAACDQGPRLHSQRWISGRAGLTRWPLQPYSWWSCFEQARRTPLAGQRRRGHAEAGSPG